MIADGVARNALPVGLGRLLAFAVVFFLLQAAYESLRDGVWDRLIIDTLTVAPSAAVVNAIAPEIGARADGPRIVASTERLSILPGCEGAEAFLLLLSGLLCARRAWRDTLLGLGLGLLVVYAANMVRIVGLFFAALRDRALFNLLHAYFAPLAVVGIAVLFFGLWLGWSERRATLSRAA